MHSFKWDFPDSSVGKESACNAGDLQFLGGKIYWRRGKATHSRILAWRTSPWGRKESDRTERLHFHFFFIQQIFIIHLICTMQSSNSEKSKTKFLVSWSLYRNGIDENVFILDSNFIGMTFFFCKSHICNKNVKKRFLYKWKDQKEQFAFI